MGILDKADNVVIKPQFDEDSYFFEWGVATVKKDGKYGVINKTGKVLIPFEYSSYILPIAKGIFMVEVNGKYGAISDDGRVLIPIQYDFISEFYHDVAKVELNGEIFYIDKQGNRLP
ncbi:WG repeat-containing protein [Moraxella bovis]|uniref:WG repeat-containing protein n=1 Tax=Moraxella bovis TaxID=476 RepID=UPI003AEF8BA3